MIEFQEASLNELIILRILWDSKVELNTVEVMNLMNSKRKEYGLSEVKMQTVCTWLVRMKEKNLISIRKDTRYSFHSPIISEFQYRNKYFPLIQYLYTGK